MFPVTVLSLGSSLPSSRGPVSQKVGHLVTFQSSSGRGTHSLHIILLLLSNPLLTPAPHSPPSASLYLSFSLFQRLKALTVLRPEVDHFNSASQIFFKKDPRPGDLRTGDRCVNSGRPARTRTLVNTAIISHALIPPQALLFPTHNGASIWCWAVCVLLAQMCLFVFAATGHHVHQRERYWLSLGWERLIDDLKVDHCSRHTTH